VALHRSSAKVERYRHEVDANGCAVSARQPRWQRRLSAFDWREK
jgi:hypothetical protein